MTFSAVTPFRLVRALAMSGVRNPSIYLLICDGRAVATVESDLLSEAKAQLGIEISVTTASQLLRQRLPPWRDGSIRLVYFDAWRPELIQALDRHSPLLVQDGGKLLLLGDDNVGQRILSAAPNLRSRLTDVFRIAPENLSGGLKT
jgi:hypothetical protein